MPNPEIEHKFLVREALLPKGLKDFPRKHITQTYTVFETEERIRTSRQQEITTFYLTKKGEGNLEREEDEKEISAKDFKSKLLHAVTRPIRKTRYQIPIQDDLTAELDCFKTKSLWTTQGPIQECLN